MLRLGKNKHLLCYVRYLCVYILSVIAFFCLFTLTGCNSEEEPLDEKYAGIYGSGQYGNLIVTTTAVSTDMLLLPQVVIDGVLYDTAVIYWEPTAFDYESDGSFVVNPYVYENVMYNVEGEANFSGQFSSTGTNYTISFNYYGNKVILFSKAE